MGKVKVEAVPWLPTTLGEPKYKRVVVEMEAAQGDTVGDLMHRLAEKHPRFKELVFDEQAQAVTGYASVVLNGEVIDNAGGMKLPVHDGDVITLIPSYMGG